MRLPTLVLLCALTPALRAEELTLERKLSVGDRVRVVERSRSELTYVYQDQKSRVGNVEILSSERQYLEEVRSARPERLWRNYALSTRSKHKPGAEPEPERTSLHGRAVLVSGLQLQPDGPFEISKQDREALRFDRLVSALLPAEPVPLRTRYEVGAAEICRALFGDYVPSANAAESGARMELRALREVKGRQVAVLRVRALVVDVVRSANFPGLHFELRGELEWALEEGVLLSAQLEGTGTFLIPLGEDGTLEGTGPMMWSYEAELVEARQPAGEADEQAGEPPPPGTRALVCQTNPAHRIELNKITHCLRCGAALVERRCPDHDWVFQRCPHDGSPWTPE